MISQNSVAGTEAVAANLVDAKKVLEVIPNTPLSYLVTETIPVITPTLGLESAAIVETTQVEDIQGVNRHEVVLDEVVGTVGSGIANQMKIACHDVIPMVRRVVAKVEDAIAETTVGDYSIETFFLAEIHDNEAIVELLTRWNEFRADKVVSPVGFQPMAEADIITMSQTGSPRLDEPMAEMIGSHPAGWATTVYEKYFGISEILNYKPVVNLRTMDELLMAFFLARNFADKPQEGSPLSLAQHNNYCATLMSHLAVGMIVTHKNWDYLRTTGAVVLSWPLASDIPTDDSQAIIQVIGDNYNNFLGAGGSPEVLIGAAMADRPYAGKALSEKMKTYLEHYQMYKVRLANYRERNLGTLVRNTLAVEIGKEIILLPEHTLKDSLSIEKLQSLLIAQVGTVLDHRLPKELYAVVRELICKVVFGHTSALEILTQIDHVMTKYKVSGREAAYRVSISMILDYWLSQLHVTRG